MPDLELVVWVILPLILSAVLLLVSLNTIRHDRRFVQFYLGLQALLLLTLATIVLVRMLQPHTWPSLVPHLALVVALPLVLLQQRLAKSQ
jgi:hypothetical protein